MVKVSLLSTGFIKVLHFDIIRYLGLDLNPHELGTWVFRFVCQAINIKVFQAAIGNKL
jgi:hypothetical protein